jgi:hypothetical protein
MARMRNVSKRRFRCQLVRAETLNVLCDPNSLVTPSWLLPVSTSDHDCSNGPSKHECAENSKLEKPQWIVFVSAPVDAL